jgi:hypothetical protein
VAADVYSLGALAFFCLTGQDPPVADTPKGAEHIARELRAVAEEAEVKDPDCLTAHILTTLESQAARRPTDLRSWAHDLLEATSPGSGRPATGAGEASGVAAGQAGRPLRPHRRAIGLALSALAVIVAASVVVLPRLFTIPDSSDTPKRQERSTALSTVGGGATVSGPAGLTGGAATATGTITSPVDGSDVKACAYFSGTASLPPDTTLILTMQNLDSIDSSKYIQVVFDYEKPATLSTWRGAQYFGSEHDGIGQNYRVELLAVNLEAARRDHESSGATNKTMVKSGVLLASVRVRRVVGTVPNACVGPGG